MTVTPVRALALLIGAALLALVTACIELDGQRIAWFHDVERDELRILLFYDGIHDKGGRSALYRGVDGAEQIRRFVEQDEVMFFDWVGHMRKERLRERLADSDEPPSPAERRFIEVALAVQVEVLGWYREPDGRVGAVQRLTIPRVTQFITELNALIDATWLAEDRLVPPAFPISDRLCVEAARTGHAWVALDGHALRVNLPVEPGEWTRGKQRMLRSLMRNLLESAEEHGGREAVEPELRRWARGFGGVPLSLLDGRDELTFVLGHREAPLRLDVLLREEYEPNMEATVQEAVGVELDGLLVERLASGESLGDALDDLLRWGPEEERVRAWLSRVAPPDGAPGDAVAWDALRAFAEAWNAGQRTPSAPRFPGELEEFDPHRIRTHWNAWYHELRFGPDEP